MITILWHITTQYSIVYLVKYTMSIVITMVTVFVYFTHTTPSFTVYAEKVSNIYYLEHAVHTTVH